MEVHGNALTPKATNPRALRQAVENALTRSTGEHSVVYVHAWGIDGTGEDRDTHRTLAKIALALGGPVTLVATTVNDYALFMEGWPSVRALGVARLICMVVRGAELRHLTGTGFSVGVLPVRGFDVDIDALLIKARQSCQAAERCGIELVQLEPS